MTSEPILLSYCIPTNNGSRWLAETLTSVLAELGDEAELVLCDDASTDGTYELACRLAGNHPRVRLYRNEKNLGLVGNWNHCMMLARGEWIKFTFQDDTVKPGYWVQVSPFLRGEESMLVHKRDFSIEPDASPEVATYFREVLWQLDELAPGVERFLPEDVSALMLRMPRHNLIGEPSNVLFRRELVERFGFFNTQMCQVVDMEYWFRLSSNVGLRYLPQSLSVFRVHGEATTAQNKNRRFFRSHYGDAIIQAHERCYSPCYQAFRNCARLLGGDVNKHWLQTVESAVRAAEKELSAGEKCQVEEAVIKPCVELCLAYPRLWPEMQRLSPGLASRMLTHSEGRLS